MRLIGFLLLVIGGNGVSFALLTLPALAEKQELEARRGELDQAIAKGRNEVARWRKLADVVELARPVVDPVPPWEGASLSGLRAAFVGAERGLPLQRLTLEFEPESKSPPGLEAFRVHVSERGDFGSLRKYLERLTRLRAPMATRSLSVIRDGTVAESFRLNATWYYLCPERSD